MSLTALPKELCEDLVTIRPFHELDLSYNDIRSFNLQLCWAFDCLTILNLSGNPNLCLGAVVSTRDRRSQASSGMVKEGSMTSLLSIPTTVHPTPIWMLSLKELNVSGCKLTRIEESDFTSFPNLTILKLSDNNLQSLPRNVFQSLWNLQQLHIGGNNLLDQLPGSLFTCCNLEVISAAGCSIYTIPNTIGDLHNLRELDLRNNCIVEIPAKIGQLTKSIPVSMANCKSLGQIGSLFNMLGNPIDDAMMLEAVSTGLTEKVFSQLVKSAAIQDGTFHKDLNLDVNVGVKCPEVTSLRAMFEKRSNESVYEMFANAKSLPQNSSTASFSLDFLPVKQQAVVAPKPRAAMDTQKTREAAIAFIRKDITDTVDGVSRRINNMSEPVEFLVECGIAIRMTNENFEYYSSLLRRPHFKFNSPSPLPTEDKMIQLRKILNQKIEKTTIYTTAILLYLNKCKNAEAIVKLYESLLDLNHKLSTLLPNANTNGNSSSCKTK
eukprot:gene14265-16839_t